MGFIDGLEGIGGRFSIQINSDACWKRLFIVLGDHDLAIRSCTRCHIQNERWSV